jgi:multidrug resistance efflux pump
MIVFLTLCYAAILAILVKLRVVPFNLWWKLSPLAWMLLLFAALFVPMQWGAPSGPVRVYRYTVEIVPGVTGNVVEVPVRPLEPVGRGDVLFRIDPEPFEREVRRLRAALAEAEQLVPQLGADVEAAEAGLKRAQAQLDLAEVERARAQALTRRGAGTPEEFDIARTNEQVAIDSVKEAEAKLKQARLALESETEEGVNTAVAQAREQLARAEYDLGQATVRAPSDGMVMQLTLRPGERVAAFPLRGAMVFVERERNRVAAAIPQYALRHVEPGQPAEVALKILPGRTLPATVESIAYMTASGQVTNSSTLRDFPDGAGLAQPYGVILDLDEEALGLPNLPGGASGTAAIYTDRARPTHVIRRVMVRMNAWLNYLVP